MSANAKIIEAIYHAADEAGDLEPHQLRDLNLSPSDRDPPGGQGSIDMITAMQWAGASREEAELAVDRLSGF